jgi:spore maturation protein CgeB
VRIFSAVRHSNVPSQYYGGLWSQNFYPALQKLGYEVIESQVDLLPTSRFMHVAGNFTPEESQMRANTTENILTELRTAHARSPITLCLFYFYNSHFDPAAFAEIRKLGIPTVNFYCNSIYQFELVEKIAAAADFAWYAEKNARERYLRAGANPVWVQMGADPGLCHPMPGVRRLAKPCFLGQRYADRDRWLGSLLGAGIDVDIYGHGWSRSKVEAESDAAGTKRNYLPKPVYLGRKLRAAGSPASYVHEAAQNLANQGILKGVARTWRQYKYRRETRTLTEILGSSSKGPVTDQLTIFSKYEVVLNFSNVWSDGRPGSTLVPHVRLRDFEAPMSRTCYLTGHSDEIAEFYEIGTEIDTYSTPNELAEKVRFYLSHPDRAEKLREAGYRRARNDHTWERRFEELFKKIGLTK